MLDINEAGATFTVLGFLDDGVVREDVLARLSVRLLGPSTRLRDLDATYVVAISARPGHAGGSTSSPRPQGARPPCCAIRPRPSP